jgi:xanthine dehydrogenase molybdenum-binding subunit
MTLLKFEVNGQPVEVDVRDNEYLSDVLRYHLGLTGTKIGCNEAECGICTVQVNGLSVDSCVFPALKAQHTKVETIEGLANDRLHPLQQAFLEGGAVQCGFCIPGLIMTAKALLEENPDPSEHDIKVALKDTYCRCAGYSFIARAIQKAGAALRGENIDFTPELPQVKAGYRWVGKPLVRPDGLDKVTGKAIYTDDLTFPGMLHAATLRAVHPHAHINSIDTAAARALAGVRAVLTVNDIPGKHNHGLVIQDWPALADGKVRYIGDPVAIVAADSRETAIEALDLIEVEYEPLPVVDDPVAARQSEAADVHESGNLLKHIKVRKGDMTAGFAEAEVTVEKTYHTATIEHAFLEPECAIGHVLDNGRIEIYVGSQIPYQDRAQVSACLGVSPEQVRIRGMMTGGGFGGKEDIAAQIHVALLAQATGRPVKMLYDRHESMIYHPKRHATMIRVRMGAKNDGTLVAVETELYGDTGAYASLGEKVMTRATTHSAGPYQVSHMKADCYAMYTNNPPSGAFRGFGVTQSAFAVESTVDILAETLNMDPFELRRKNALRIGSVTNTGQELRESVGLIECLDKVEAELWKLTEGRNPYKPRQVHGSNKVRAWGVAAGYKNTGLGGGAPDKSAAEVELFADGTAEVRTSAAEIGQGLVGVLAIVVAEELGLRYEDVKVLVMDTDLTPDGGPTTASRQTYVSGNAARMASQVLRDAMTAIQYVEGLAQINGRRVPVGEVVGLMKNEGRVPKALYEYWAPKTQPLGTGGDMHFAFSFGAQAAEVEVDLDTGQVHVLHIVSGQDIGRAINLVGLQGQIEGGIMMGLGNALTEEFIVEAGIPFTDYLARYKMPSIKHMPKLTSFIVEDEAAQGPFGAKGIGELASIPTTPAITNAIYNACGIRVCSLPVDQDKLLLALKRAQMDDFCGLVPTSIR